MIDSIGVTKAPIHSISRHRLLTDGNGVTTLVIFNGCPLNCRYCLNPSTLHSPAYHLYTPSQLFDEVKIDEIYFLATGGGVTFGGGEPGMRTSFIVGFREVCGSQWHLTVETSLNYPSHNLIRLLDVVDNFIIDVKDLNPVIYRHYTCCDNTMVIENLKLIKRQNREKDCLIRLPLIPGFNSAGDRETSLSWLKDIGFHFFEPFNYIIRDNPLWESHTSQLSKPDSPYAP